MLALAHIALGLVISATPVADHQAAQPPKDPPKAAPADKREKHAPPAQESLRPPIGPRTTQGLAEDAINRGKR